jgi:stearoyl-CoA desaturase (delta-9 desaturase)
MLNSSSTSAGILSALSSSPRIGKGVTLSRLNWHVVLGIGAVHVLALLAPFTFSWAGLIAFIFLAWLSGGVGITLCFHRLLTHRSFKTPKWFEYLTTFCGCLAWQGSPIDWVGTHRIHHQHSDADGDPHTPQHGFTWAHVLWCMHKYPDEQDPKHAARDLMRDTGQRLFRRWYVLPQVIVAVLLFGAGEWLASLGIATSGLSLFIWGSALRTVVVYHGTWFVNSAAHTWGYRNFDTKDHSTNLWWVAVVSFGEGWHNNHHAQQRSAAHGMRWWEFDLTYRTIKLLALIGLARDIVEPKPTQTAA